MRRLDNPSSETNRPSLRLAPPPPRRIRQTWYADDRPIELRLSFRELTLIHKSLQAVKTLGAHAQDELLNDTMQLVDLALNEAV